MYSPEDVLRFWFPAVQPADSQTGAVYRGTARAFAEDPKALALAEEGIRNGQYDALGSPWEKTFFVLPLAHSEDLARHEVCVRLTERIAAEAPEALREILSFSAGSSFISAGFKVDRATTRSKIC